MFSRADKRVAENRAVAKSSVPSIVSADLRIQGDLTSDGDIQVDGNVEGTIKSRAVTVGESGSVRGEIIAETVRVCGSVTGQIKAKSVSLIKTARVVGDVLHESLAIEPHAFIEGQCRRVDWERKPSPPDIDLGGRLLAAPETDDGGPETVEAAIAR